MNPTIGILAVAILLVTPVIGVSDTSNDNAAIRALQQQHGEAFRTHDAHLMATQFTDDADLVNVAGQWWKRRAEIEAKLSDLFATVFRNSAWTANEVVIRYLKSDVAIVHVRWNTSRSGKTPTLTSRFFSLPRRSMRIYSNFWLNAA
jgi:uncharacterized protein (TIGR02246 family)